MLTITWVVQIITAILLIILVLIHSPKGDGLGAIGGMANIFASQKSAESGLNRLTANVVMIFIITSFITGFNKTLDLQFWQILVLVVPVLIIFYFINRVK